MALSIPAPYTLFFLYIEPIATLVGAYFAWIIPSTYLHLTQAASGPERLLGLPVSTQVAVQQLGNLYTVFAFTEAFVLRSTTDLKVWKTLLLGFLIADFGHLAACYPLGLKMYYDVRSWNSIAYGNYLFVYIGAIFRTCFLLDVGLGGPKKAKRTARKSIKSAEEQFAALVPSPAQLNKTPAQSTRRKKNKSVSAS